MQELLDIAIPAVVLVPLIIVGAAVWLCIRQNARASELRRAEFLMLKRKTEEEQERAEREFEEEYSRNRQPDYRVDYRRRPAAENLYQKRAEVNQEPWKNVDAEFHRNLFAEEATQRRKLIDSVDFNRRRKEEENRTKQTEIEEYNRKIQEEELRRRQADLEEYNRRKLEDELRRREAEAEEYNRRLQAEEVVRKRQAEAEERKQREAAEQEFFRRRQAEEEEKKRQAEIAAKARAEAEEVIRRKQRDEEASREGLEEEKALKQDVVRHVERKVHSDSHLVCAVCHQPTKRRCSRCKSVFYWYVSF
jgi:colicin import membrane protein